MGNVNKNIGRLLVAVGVLMILGGLQGVRSEYGDLAGNWLVDYDRDELNFFEDSTWSVDLHIYNVLPKDSSLDYYFVVYSKDDRRASSPPLEIKKEDFDLLGSWRGALYVTGVRFGYSSLEVELKSGAVTETYPKPLPITVLRTQVVDERITTYVSAALALLMFLNLGTVLDMQRLAGIICRPVGPVVGVVSRFVLMPAVGFGLGRALWPDSWPLQLALFYTALSPSGGLANVCAVFLKGNINLSVATTTINSLLALALLPIWILVLGRILYEDDELTVPFGQLSGGAAALVACLAIGVLLRLCLPRTTRFIFRFLKPLSVVLSLCLVGLTVGLNSFVFYEFTWQVSAVPHLIYNSKWQQLILTYLDL